jgi:hypothetical protein
VKKNSKSEESSKMTTLWKCDECFVYRVPPRKMGSRGYRADEWDLASPALTCRCEVVDMKESCHVKLFDKKTDKLAACSDINIEEKGDRSKLAFYLESVVDSSRYYVLRVEDKKTKRVIYLGLGFRKRPDSSNFFESIQDFVRFRKRDFVAQRRQAEFDAMADTMPAPDETSSSKKKKKEKKEEDEVEIDFSAMKLDGPDAPSKKKKKKKKKKIKKEKTDSKKKADDKEDDDDDWGDFTDFTSASS